MAATFADDGNGIYMRQDGYGRYDNYTGYSYRATPRAWNEVTLTVHKIRKGFEPVERDADGTRVVRARLEIPLGF